MTANDGQERGLIQLIFEVDVLWRLAGNLSDLDLRSPLRQEQRNDEQAAEQPANM
ncbi:MAG TPA: hypothetical protein VE715_14985 [Blastocatellia bacterium]|nr:hypothetical protein [Blastocatellia bacterium]